MATITIPGMFLTGDHASRPAANAVGSGSIYSCSTHSLLYQSDGSTWSTWATLGGDVSAHTGDTSDAHDASAISIADAGTYFTGTDVEAALQELGAAGGGSFDEDLLPWTVDLDVFMTAATNTNWNTLLHESAAGVNFVYAATKESSQAQNDNIGWDIVLAAGTWTFELMHRTWSDRGIYSVRFDGVEQGTIDGYSGSAVENVRSTVTGITVATSGKVRLLLQMATKNASSSNYRGSIQHIQLRRTA